MINEMTNENLVNNGNQNQSNNLCGNSSDDTVIWLYNVTDINTYIEIHRKLEELDYFHELNGISTDCQKLSQTIQDEICGDNFLKLNGTDWDKFTQNYIWTILIIKGFSREENTVEDVIGDSEKMVWILEYLNLFGHLSDTNKRIIDFLNKNRNGVIPIE